MNALFTIAAAFVILAAGIATMGGLCYLSIRTFGENSQPLLTVHDREPKLVPVAPGLYLVDEQEPEFRGPAERLVRGLWAKFDAWASKGKP